MPTSIDPIKGVIGIVASVAVSWILIREIGRWLHGVIREQQWRKLLNVSAVGLWVITQIFIIIYLASPKNEVRGEIPNLFPVLVITPGDGDEKYKAQSIFYYRLDKFINKNPEYTFLVPEGQEDHLHRTLHGGIEVKELSAGRQSWEVKIKSGESWCTGWYEATDKKNIS